MTLRGDDIIRALWTVLSAALSLVLASFGAGCSQDTSEFDRIAMPARFAVIRDTAQWVPEFDPVWWKAIDAAYGEYDRSVEEIVRARWAPLLKELNLAGQTPVPFAPDDARTRRARQRAIDAELAAAEQTLIARIDAELPPEADRFIALLTARIDCERALAVWTEPGRPAPAALEELCRVGVHAGDDAILDAATRAYADLAREARRLSNDRAKAYLAWTEDFAALDATLKAERANAPNGQGRAVDRAQKALDRRLESMRGGRAETTEALRMKLLEAGDEFARAIADERVRAEFTERLEADLHEGMSTTRTLEMYARIAERVIAQANPDDPSKVESFRDDVARGLELQRTRRAALRSSDSAERSAAYKELSKMPGEILASAGKKLEERMGGRLFWQAVRVDLGQIGEDEAVAAVFAQDPPKQGDPNPADVAEGVVGVAGSAEQVAFYGTALSPRVVRALGAGLRIEGERKAEFDAFVDEQAKALVESLKVEAQRGEDGVKQLGSNGQGFADSESMRSAVREAMGTLRASMSAMLALNRGANARVLDAAARIAGVRDDDPVIEEARIELELLAHVGSRGLGQRAGRRELEGFAGATVECYSNPFAVARLIDAPDDTRDAVAAIIGTHSGELLAAAQAVREQVLANLEDFLMLLASRERAREFGLPPWNPKIASPEAVELRFRIAEEIGDLLGADVMQEYERAWRRFEQPTLATPRSAAVTRVQAALGQRAVDPLAESALRAVLAASEGTRERAVRATHRWRATTVVGDRLESGDQWRTLVFNEPVGAFLHSRIADADERGVATCEAVAALTGASDALREAFLIRERPIVRTFRPR
jgi:hypothetical protein